MCIDDYNGDNFDHGPLGFVGGGYMGQVQTNGRPIETTPVPAGTPTWGAKWKAAVKENYNSSVYAGAGVHGSFYAYDDVFMDLDPTYKDRFGRPLVRMTIDFHDNEHRMSAFLTDRYAEILRAMGGEPRRQAAAHRPLQRHRLPDLAPVRRRHHGGGPEDLRGQSLPSRTGTCRTSS